MEKLTNFYVFHRHVGVGRVCKDPIHSEVVGKEFILTAPHSVLGSLGEIIEQGDTSGKTIAYFRVKKSDNTICEFLAMSKVDFERAKSLTRS